MHDAEVMMNVLDDGDDDDGQGPRVDVRRSFGGEESGGMFVVGPDSSLAP